MEMKGWLLLKDFLFTGLDSPVIFDGQFSSSPVIVLCGI
jgi:hypothetical protein